MKFYMSLIMVIISTFQLLAIDFKDEQFNINMAYNDLNWIKVPGEKFRNRLVLKHVNQPSTLNIIAYKFNETITANGIVERRINAVFDGWQLLSNTSLKSLDLKRLNIIEGIGSIYRKPYLDDSLNENYRVVAEMCMVAPDEKLGIILNIESETMSAMIATKPEFEYAYESFWYGKEKPNFNFIKNNQAEWVMSDQNVYRSRYSQIKYQLFDSVKILNDQEMSKNVSFKNGKHLFNKKVNFIIDEKETFALDKIGNITKFNIDTYNKELILADDGVFVISKKPKLKITKYDFNFNLVETIEHNEYVENLFYNNNFFIFFSDSKIELVKEGKIIWTHSHSYDISHYSAYNDILIVTDNSDTSIKAINLNDGKLLNSIDDFNKIGTPKEEGEPKKYTFSDLLIQDKYLIVTGTRPSKYGKRYALASINLDELEIGELDIRGFSKASMIGATNDFLVIHYQKRGSDNMFLEALDFNTFEPIWKIDFNNMNDVWLTPKQVIALYNNEKLISFNIKNGKVNSEINLVEIYNKSISDETNSKTEVMRMFLFDNKITSIIKKDNTSHAVSLR